MPITVTMLQTRQGEGAMWTAGNTYSASDVFGAYLIASNLATGSIPQPVKTSLGPADLAALSGMLANAWVQTADGGVHTLSEVQAVVSATATATAFSGACLFRGIVVRAIVGTPQTITVYDATSAAGTPIATFTIAALGTYFWDGDQVTAGNGRGGRRQNTTGCHVVIAGGTSRTIDVMVGAA